MERISWVLQKLQELISDMKLKCCALCREEKSPADRQVYSLGNVAPLRSHSTHLRWGRTASSAHPTVLAASPNGVVFLELGAPERTLFHIGQK